MIFRVNMSCDVILVVAMFIMKNEFSFELSSMGIYGLIRQQTNFDFLFWTGLNKLMDVQFWFGEFDSVGLSEKKCEIYM